MKKNAYTITTNDIGFYIITEKLWGIDRQVAGPFRTYKEAQEALETW
jgi:hypothetical protein